MNDDEFRALLDLYMSLDNWDGWANVDDKAINRLIDRESLNRGYASWVVAFHEFQK